MNSTSIDLIIRIKNGYLAEKKQIHAPYSRVNSDVLTILKEEGYIEDFSIAEDGNKKDISIDLLYRDREPAVQDVKVYSSPGRREYVGLKDIKPVLGGLGISILSTSKGLMTDTKARKAKVGGELLFSIW